jgi:hypothetical protein
MADRKEEEQARRRTESPPKSAKGWCFLGGMTLGSLITVFLLEFAKSFGRGLGEDSYSVTKEFVREVVGDATPQAAKNTKRLVVLSVAQAQSGDVRTGFLGLGGVVHRAEFRVTLTNVNVVDVPRASINFRSMAGNVVSVSFPSILNATIAGERPASPWFKEGDYPTQEVTLEVDMPATNMFAGFSVVVLSDDKPINSNDLIALLRMGNDFWEVQSK